MRLILLGVTTLSAAILTGAAQPAQRAAFPDPGHLYRTGVSAKDFVADRVVYGGDGEVIGEVADLMVGPRGRVQSVLVRTSGFLGWGDSLRNVPIGRIEGGVIGSDPVIRVPITADEVNGFGAPFDRFRPAAGQNTKSGTSKRLMSGIGAIVKTDGAEVVLGYVDDFVLSGSSVTAVAILPAGKARFVGGRALPFVGLGPTWKPGEGLFRPSLRLAEVTRLPRFDRRRLLQPVGQ